MDKIALIGAAGAIGQSIARAVSAQGARYRVVGRSRDALTGAFGSDALADIVTWNPDDPTSVRAAAAGIDTMVYLVGVNYWQFELHPRLMKQTLDGAVAEDVKRIVLIGTVVELHHANESPEPADELTRQDDNRQYPPRLPNRQQDNGVVEDPLPRGVSGDRLVLRVKSAHRRSSAVRSALMSGVEQTVTPAFAMLRSPMDVHRSQLSGIPGRKSRSRADRAHSAETESSSPPRRSSL
jgi:hypothetical protein